MLNSVCKVEIRDVLNIENAQGIVIRLKLTNRHGKALNVWFQAMPDSFYKLSTLDKIDLGLIELED